MKLFYLKVDSFDKKLFISYLYFSLIYSLLIVTNIHLLPLINWQSVFQISSVVLSSKMHKSFPFHCAFFTIIIFSLSFWRIFIYSAYNVYVRDKRSMVQAEAGRPHATSLREKVYLFFWILSLLPEGPQTFSHLTEPT